MPPDQASTLPGPLIDRFVRHLAEVHADVLAMEAQLVCQTAHRPAILERMRDVAHRLAGTAEGYGFANLGVSARALEQAICADGAQEAAIAAPLSDFRQRLGAAALPGAG